MKLRSRLVLAIVPIVLVALVALGYVAYAQMEDVAGDDLEQQMSLVLEQSTREWQNMVSTLNANAELFAGSDLIERYALIDDEGERVDLMQPAVLQLFSSYQRAYPSYREIRFLLPDGYEDTRLTTAAIPNATEEEGDTGWFTNLRRATDDARDTSYLQFDWSPDDQAPVLTIGRAMHIQPWNRSAAQSERELRGYLTVTAEVHGFADAISLQRIGNTGTVVLMDDMARPVGKLSSQASPALRNALLSAGASTGDAPTHRLLVAGQWIMARSVMLPGGLSVHAIVPEAEFAAARTRLGLWIGGVAALAIAAVSAALLLVLRGLILEPLARLAITARAIGNGQLDAPLALRRNDEIGELADAFRDMRGKLADSMNALTTSHDRIEQLAFTDSLTGLPNRRAFLALVDETLDDKSSAPGSHLPHSAAILFLDLDGFKRINDTLGHEAGDRLLVAVADRLGKCSGRDTSRAPVARLGGDEFCLLLPGADTAQAVRVAERILEALRNPVVLGSREVVVGTSIGIAMYPIDERCGDGLLKCADVAMYDAKREGPNRWRLYGHAMQEGLERRMELENELRRAVDEGTLSLDYQPQYDLGSGAMIGCEALLRWRHPQLGFVSPADFIPVAETTGLIAAIGEWVLDEACRQWKRWEASGIAPPRIAVNVSQRQFTSGDIAAQVESALDRHAIDPDVLELELTESCMMETESDVVDALARVRELGVRIAMDDFGTGYSSLAALTQLPIDTLKIDRSFITGIRADSPNQKVVSAILTLARGLDLEIVAEGVETDDELDFLRENACDIVQGFLLSKPLPVLAMTALLQAEYGIALAG